NSVTNAQKEPLAILWEVEDKKVLELLNVEKKLIMVDGILQPLLDKFSSSFGGSYIDVFKEKVFINTLDFSKTKNIESTSEIKPYKNLLEFKPASNSLVELRSKFQTICKIAEQNLPKNVEIFIDMEQNNVVVQIKRKLGDRKFIDSIMPLKPLIIFVREQTSPSNSSQSSNSKLMTDMIFADMINIGGDSGGSVFTYSNDLRSVNLVGILSSGNLGVKRNVISTIQPLKVILETLDLVLVVLGQVVHV
ncbi:15131_t:CDS:2, partial [Racocetra persica]